MAKDSKAETLSLPVKLDELTILERSRELAAEVRKHDAAQTAQKQSAKEHKGIVDTHEVHIRRLSEIVNAGEELRSVDCEWQADAGLKVLRLVRMDTYKVVRSRPMSDDEIAEASQGQFPFLDARRAAETTGERKPD